MDATLTTLAARTLNATSGAPISWLYAGRGHVLMFHRVQPPSTDRPRLFANSYLEVTPDYLENTIRYFQRRRYAFLAVDEIQDFLAHDRTGRKFVCYTFDDGYRDNFELALPIFRRFQVPVCVYITTGFPDRTAMLWWNEVEQLVFRGESLTLTIASEERTFPTRDDGERTAAFKAISRWLKYAKGSSLEQRIREMLEPLGIDPLDQARRLAATWEELRQASDEPLLTLGAHTLSHPVLAELSDEEAAREIEGSRRRLETELGRAVRHFAYPYGGPGEITGRDIALAASAGFASAATTYSANVHTAHLRHPYSLPRIAVGMSMTETTFDLIRHGAVPAVRNRGRRVVAPS